MREEEKTIAELDLEGCRTGKVLDPLAEWEEWEKRAFSSWETPLAPRGGFTLDSGLEVVRDGERLVLEWRLPEAERAIVTTTDDIRDCRVVAELKPFDVEHSPIAERDYPRGILAGIVFHTQTSRQYYQFGVE